MFFDTQNPIGFTTAITLQYIAVSYLLHVTACVLSIGVGAYIFAIATTKEIERAVNDFNIVAKGRTTAANHAFLMSQFSVFIDAHSTVKQLSKLFLKAQTANASSKQFQCIFRIATNFSDVFQPIFMVLFSWCIIAISGLMLLIQIEIVKFFGYCLLISSSRNWVKFCLHWIFQFHRKNDSMALWVVIFVAGYALATAFISCELGQRMNDAFRGIGDFIYQCDWHLFPIEIKRVLPTSLVILQQSVSLQCFGSIACNREVFKKVSLHGIHSTIFTHTIIELTFSRLSTAHSPISWCFVSLATKTLEFN